MWIPTDLRMGPEKKQRNNKICANPTTIKSTPKFEAAWLTHRGEMKPKKKKRRR